MNLYKVKIEPEALTDIEEIIKWYNEQQIGLGLKFKKVVFNQVRYLAKSPFIYSIRYNEIRCMLIKKFPFMVHYFVNDENRTVEILAVISTSRNPKIWQEKINKR